MVVNRIILFFWTPAGKTAIGAKLLDLNIYCFVEDSRNVNRKSCLADAGSSALNRILIWPMFLVAGFAGLAVEPRFLVAGYDAWPMMFAL